jgi:hypothetical protein
MKEKLRVRSKFQLSNGGIRVELHALLQRYPPQRVESFVEAILLRRDVNEHEGFAVAAQGVLQQVGQLRVPVGHVRALHNNQNCYTL